MKRRQNFSFARIFARILPGFLLKIRPDSARIFTKMSPDEELGTLIMVYWSMLVIQYLPQSVEVQGLSELLGPQRLSQVNTNHNSHTVHIYYSWIC